MSAERGACGLRKALHLERERQVVPTSKVVRPVVAVESLRYDRMVADSKVRSDASLIIALLMSLQKLGEPDQTGRGEGLNEPGFSLSWSLGSRGRVEIGSAFLKV